MLLLGSAKTYLCEQLNLTWTLMSERKKQIVSLLKKAGTALGMAGLFTFLSIFPGLGYHGEAATQIIEKDPVLPGFWIVEAQCNVSFNPFLFPYSWVSGTGNLYKARFRFLSVPTYAGYEFKVPVWRSTEELNEEAIIIVLVNRLVPNFLPSFFILFAIALLEQKLLYLCLFGGIIGFLVGSVLGSVLGLAIMVFLTYYVMPKFKVFEFIYKYL